MRISQWYSRIPDSSLRGDIYGGLTSAVVALPLALAFGVASGAGALAGLYGAICVGLFAAIFGGTPSQVSGPTGPMTVAFAAVVIEFGDDTGIVFAVVVMAGALQVLFGLLRLGQYINFVPSSVVSGFMSGIGAIIILLQVAPLVGHPAPKGTMLRKAAELPSLLSHPVWDALAIGLITLLIVYLFPKRISRWVPSPLFALLVGTMLGAFVFKEAPTIGEIPTGWPEWQVPQFSADRFPTMLRFALVIAFLGSIDSLLTSLIADRKTGTDHNSDRELMGQGIGNIVSGFLGALPGAGATMRTVTNLRAGGRTPVSGALHSLVLLAILIGTGGLAEKIPLAVLGGILVKVGIDIVDWPYLRQAIRSPRPGTFIMFVTLLLTVLVDLVTAVGVGFLMAALLFLKRSSDAQIRDARLVSRPGTHPDFDEEEDAILEKGGGRIAVFDIDGPLAFATAKEVARILSESNRRGYLILDFSEVPFIDSTAALALDEVIHRMRQRNFKVSVCGARREVLEKMEKLGILHYLAEDGIFSSRVAAMRHAGKASSDSSDSTRLRDDP